jgi:hypothetical protein
MTGAWELVRTWEKLLPWSRKWLATGARLESQRARPRSVQADPAPLLIVKGVDHNAPLEVVAMNHKIMGLARREP